MRTRPDRPKARQANAAGVAPAGDDDFDAAVAAAGVPVLVDLRASWCPPCRALAPVVRAVAARLAGRVKVLKGDVDESPALARRFRVDAVPTLVLLHGRRRSRQVGFMDRRALEEWVTGTLAEWGIGAAPRPPRPRGGACGPSG